MASNYPGGLDNFSESSPTYMSDPDTTGRVHAARHNDVESAVEQIEETLGVNPQGASSTVGLAIAERALVTHTHESGSGQALAWGNITGDIDAQTDLATALATQGLHFIVAQSFVASSAVSVNNCFTPAYDTYRVLVSPLSVSVETSVSMRMRAGGVDAAAGNYFTQSMYAYGTNTGAGGNGGTATAFDFTTSLSEGFIFFDIARPRLADKTAIAGGKYSYQGNVSTMVYATIAGLHNTAAQYDGFTLYPDTGTITGTVRVYGYAN